MTKAGISWVQWLSMYRCQLRTTEKLNEQALLQRTERRNREKNKRHGYPEEELQHCSFILQSFPIELTQDQTAPPILKDPRKGDTTAFLTQLIKQEDFFFSWLNCYHPYVLSIHCLLDDFQKTECCRNNPHSFKVYYLIPTHTPPNPQPSFFQES